MQVQCKACKSILSIAAVNESQPPTQIRCSCGVLVSGSTGMPVANDEAHRDSQAKTQVHATTPPLSTGSSSVAYVLGAIPTAKQKQAEQPSLFRFAGTDTSANTKAAATKPSAPELRLVRPEPAVSPSLTSTGEKGSVPAQPIAFRLVDSQPTEAQEESALKLQENPTLRFASDPEEQESTTAMSGTAVMDTSPAPAKTADRENMPSVSAVPTGSSRGQNKKRRPGAWRQCVEHPQIKSETMCPTCAVGYCTECKKTICPTCDTPCIEAAGYQKWLEQERIRARPMMEEIKTILAYPLQDPMAFFIFAFITGFFKFAALFSHRVLVFSTGILLWYSFHTLYQVASGNMKRLLPEFNDISDLTHPIRLSVAALAITWGPVALVGLLFAANAETAGVDMGSMVAGATGVPAETLAPPVNVDEQVQEKVQSILGGVGGEETESDGSSSEEDTPRERIAESTASKEADSTNRSSPVTSALPFYPQKTGVGLSVLLFVTLFWKVAYTPVALIVAALSKNLWSVVNPLIGLATIRRMGTVYWHVIIIYTGLTVAEWGLGKMFDLFPLVGLAGMAFVKAYIALAVGCALGLAVYKKAPELGWD